jgi:hypothetical protein
MSPAPLRTPSSRRGRLPLALLAGLLAAAPSLAQISPNGGQFQVNSYTTGAQRYPAAATDGTGRVVVVWERGDGSTVSGQRFSASGAPAGGEFVISQYPAGFQPNPRYAVGADGAGRFVAAWSSYGTPGTDNGLSIQARRYAASGTPAAGQFQVNTYTTGDQTEPDIAVAESDGRFVVVWTSEVSVGNDSEGTSIQGRLFNATGTPISTFQVNNLTANDQTQPAVAMAPGGSFVVAWKSYTDGDQSGIQARRFSSGGSPAASQFLVNAYTTGVQGEPDVAVDPQGRFVVAWTSNEATGDADLESIQARRFAATGSPAAGQFQVNQITTDSQRRPSVAVDDAGSFVIGWESYSGDGDATSTRARRYNAAGTALTAEFQVNSYTTSYQETAAVTADGDGNFFVVWNSFGSTGTDNEGWGVHARRYDSLFRDGLEGGSTARWSTVVP